MADLPAPFPPKITVNGDGAAVGALSFSGIEDEDSGVVNGPLSYTGIEVEDEDSAASPRPHPGQISIISLSIKQSNIKIPEVS